MQQTLKHALLQFYGQHVAIRQSRSCMRVRIIFAVSINMRSSLLWLWKKAGSYVFIEAPL